MDINCNSVFKKFSRAKIIECIELHISMSLILYIYVPYDFSPNPGYNDPGPM